MLTVKHCTRLAGMHLAIQAIESVNHYTLVFIHSFEKDYKVCGGFCGEPITHKIHIFLPLNSSMDYEPCVFRQVKFKTPNLWKAFRVKCPTHRPRKLVKFSEYRPGKGEGGLKVGIDRRISLCEVSGL